VGEYASQARSLVEKYTREGPALHVEFHNPTAQEVLFVARGSIARTFVATKSVDLPCPCVRWLDKAVEVRVPPGERFTLIFEHYNPWRNPVQLVPEGREEETWILEEPPFEEPAEITWTGNGGWHPGLLPESGPTLSLRWVGPRPEGAGAPEEGDDELRSQLEALGYL
jgi:hypothetical protein